MPVRTTETTPNSTTAQIAFATTCAGTAVIGAGILIFGLTTAAAVYPVGSLLIALGFTGMAGLAFGEKESKLGLLLSAAAATNTIAPVLSLLAPS